MRRRENSLYGSHAIQLGSCGLLTPLWDSGWSTAKLGGMPIGSIGGIWSANLWNPKYASHVYNVPVALAMLGSNGWICPLALGTSADVLIWDGHGPSCTRGDFFDFEIGGHDGAYKGRIHVILPVIARKNGTLTAWQQLYNNVHGWYRACIEHLFGQLWHWHLVRNI